MTMPPAERRGYDLPAVDRAEQLDALFREAASAIDAGDIDTLERLLASHPNLVRKRLGSPGAWLRDQVGRAVESGGFFRRPYLLWFVAEDPVRNGKLPQNIAEVTRTIIAAARRTQTRSLQKQLDCTLRLVAWSGIAQKCGVQIELVDVLIDAGAACDGISDSALVNGNTAAAERLIERGAKLTLATAVCLGRWDDAVCLAPTTRAREKQMGFVLAALNGKAEALARMLAFGVDLNAPSRDLYSHATPLHHAVCSGVLDAVRVLVEAGARLSAIDTVHQATPLGWAEYYQDETKRVDEVKEYAAIAAYLRERDAQS